MKAYRFGLATLVRVREAGERAERQRLAVAVGGLTAARCRAAVALDAYRAGAVPPELAEGDRLASWHASQSASAAAVVAAERGALDAGTAVELARQRWQAARREVRLLERLDERRRREWEAEAARAERSELDDRPRPRGEQ